MAEFLFIVYAAIACGGALAVVLSQNVVRMAFWLVVSLGSTAGLFFLLDADFVAATQLLIYVGGTVVLLIFGVMLTASAPQLAIKTSPAELLQAAIVGVAFLTLVASTVMSVDWTSNEARLANQTGHHEDHGHGDKLERGYNPPSEGNTTRSLGAALLGVRFDRDLGTADHHHGQVSTGYLLPFEIISVHLLVVLVGAAYLARAKRRQKSPENI